MVQTSELKETANPSFPYLKNKLAERSDTHIVSTMDLRMAKEVEWTVKQKQGWVNTKP